MSDAHRRNASPAGRAGRPGAVSPDALPGDDVVSGEIRSREESSKMVQLDEGSINQLALALERRMQEPFMRWSFGELAALWLASVKRVRLADEQRAVVMLKPLWEKREIDLKPENISDWFDHLLRSGYSPISINKYRSAGKLAVEFATANGRWRGPNPFEHIRRMREPKRAHEILSLGDFRKASDKLEPTRRRMARIAFVLGLRKGELFALQRSDVDFQRAVVHIHRSHERDTTKTGHPRFLPLLGCLAADFIDACSAATGALLFPNEAGELQRADAKYTTHLRTAMARAGLVTGYQFWCRAPECDYEIEFSGPCETEGECPRHGWKLWRKAKVRPIRWSDLRHNAATHHRRAGADALAVKMLLGHIGGDITEDTYTHMDMAWFRAELSKLTLDSF